MEIQTNDVDKIQKELVISLAPEEIEPYVDKAVERLSKNMNVKGFREGNVPRNVVENSVGKDTVWREAASDAIEEAYWNTIEDRDIDAIGMPKINVTKLVPDNEVEFKATVPVMPELDLPDYKAIAEKVRKEEGQEIQVEDKEVEDSLKWVYQQQQGQNQNEEGDGSADTDKESESQEPEINDEFAKSLGNFESLDELKESMREGLKQEKENQERQRLRLRIIEEIRKKLDLNIPETLITAELDKMQEELTQQVASMNMSLDQYLEQTGKSIDEVREGWKDKAEERVLSGIVLRAIAEEENVEVSQEEIEEEANKYLQRFQGPEEAKENIDPQRLHSYIRGIMRNEKVFELLESNNSKT